MQQYFARVDSIRHLDNDGTSGKSSTATETERPQANKRQSRLLVADDDPMNREVLSMRLEFEGYEVDTAEDGEDALRKLEEQKFDLVLLDLVMPVMEGDEVLKRMKADQTLREIPVIMISGLEDLDTVARCIELGADDYLQKPYKPVLLRARINACLEKKQLREQEQATYAALMESQQHLAAELSEAAEYVKSLLPEPLAGEVCTESVFVTSTQLGGDSFGYHWLDDDHLAMFLLDVCGHGVGAALLSISAMNVLRSQTLPNTDFTKPGQVLERLNNSFQMERHNNMYFTIWYGVYRKSAHEIIHACGGHPPAILLTGEDRQNVTVEKLKAPGLVIGSMPDVPYQERTQKLGRYNEVYLFSDGVYELEKPDGNMWELDDFIEVLKTPPPAGKSEIDRAIDMAKEIQDSDDFEDDFSMVKFTFPVRD